MALVGGSVSKIFYFRNIGQSHGHMVDPAFDVGGPCNGRPWLSPLSDVFSLLATSPPRCQRKKHDPAMGGQWRVKETILGRKPLFLLS